MRSASSSRECFAAKGFVRRGIPKAGSAPKLVFAQSKTEASVTKVDSRG